MTRAEDRPVFDWACRAIGDGARMVWSRRLVGGITSTMRALTIADATGRLHRVVLRTPDHPGHDEDDDDDVTQWFRREADILRMLGPTSIPAPELIACDATGEQTGGTPALLMSRVPGRVHLAPRDPERWVRQMAQQLAGIHSSGLSYGTFERWGRTHLKPPTGARDPARWQRAIDVIHGEPSGFEPTFIHRDYQHFNMLWTRERLTGVVDWASGVSGPPDVDLGHCRLNLAVLYSADLAERFRLAYEAEAGRTVDPWWDLDELLIFGDAWPRFIPLQVGGRIPVDTVGMTGRVEELVRIVLGRL